MDEDFELETADFVNDQNKDGFEVPLGENEDPASDDDMGKRGFNQLLILVLGFKGVPIGI